MRMYAACLASYNNGCLHGEWFDLEDYEDADELQDAIAEKVLRTSPYPNVEVEVDCPECNGEADECPRCGGYGDVKVPSAEEWAAHDYDGEGLSSFGEYPNLEKLLAHVRLITEHGDAWVAFTNAFGDDVTEANFEESYRGGYDTEADFAEEWCCEMQGLTGNEAFYSWIDWQSAWDRDLRHDFVFEGGYVFYRNW